MASTKKKNYNHVNLIYKISVVYLVGIFNRMILEINCKQYLFIIFRLLFDYNYRHVQRYN
jgi:hypothetical protein